MSIKKILLAEDDLDDQVLFRSFLEHRRDIDILPIAENGVVVFDILEKIDGEEYLPDIIILDQNMPKRSGLQTLQLLKKTNRYNDIPVFVYSTYMDDKLKAECMANGALAVITKPVTKDGYNGLIDGFLKDAL